MSVELKDFRGKITTEIDVVLEAKSRATGRDRAEIARDVLQAWALRELHEARLTAALAAAQGVPGTDQGISGSGAAHRGARR
ncbi:MAG TPA: hypothetical protein VGG49_02425 [Steroidobacteraceae bacterium]|jgi:hypothetical protein